MQIGNINLQTTEASTSKMTEQLQTPYSLPDSRDMIRPSFSPAV